MIRCLLWKKPETLKPPATPCRYTPVVPMMLSPAFLALLYLHRVMSAWSLHRIGNIRLPQFPACPLSDVRTYWGSLLLSRTGTPEEHIPCSPPVWSSFQTAGRSGPASFPSLSSLLFFFNPILPHRIGLSPVPNLPCRGDALFDQTRRKTSCSCSSASRRAFTASSYRTNRPRIFRFP